VNRRWFLKFLGLAPAAGLMLVPRPALSEEQRTGKVCVRCRKSPSEPKEYRGVKIKHTFFSHPPWMFAFTFEGGEMFTVCEDCVKKMLMP